VGHRARSGVVGPRCSSSPERPWRDPVPRVSFRPSGVFGRVGFHHGLREASRVRVSGRRVVARRKPSRP
jgi:hypothetical protein